MISEDPFAILALEEDASPAKVESAFRHLALRCHPDRHPKDPLAKSRFLKISRAKEILLDPSKRKIALSNRQIRLSKQKRAPESKRSDAQEMKRRSAEKSEMARRTKRKREAAAEKLKRREAEAVLRKQCAKEEKKNRDHILAEQEKRKRAQLLIEERAREKAAQHLREKAAAFETFLERKRTKAFEPRSRSSQPALAEAVERFSKSADRVHAIPGPLSEEEEVKLIALAAMHKLAVVKDGVSFSLSHIGNRADNDQPCEHNSGIGKYASDGATEKHRQALERLKVRRQSGEGLMQTTLGSWWVRDDEAERWSKYIDRCGF